MTTLIALFRAINVGGKNPLPMKALVALLEEIGATNVRTYIQSGNAVFRCRDEDPARLAERLSATIARHHGFSPQVLVLDREVLTRAMAENPFPEAEADPVSLHLGFLAAKPENPDLAGLDSLRKESERFHLGTGVFYLHAPEGVGRSRLAANAEKLLGVPMTDRNWRTVCRIRELVGE